MKQLIKVRLGSVGLIVGILGAGFAVGGVDNAETFKDWVVCIGTAVTSLMLMQLSVWLIKEEI